MTTVQTENTILIRNPALTVIRCNADEIMVRRGSRSRTSFQLKDDQRRGVLADLVEALALPTPHADACAPRGDAGGEQVATLLQSLLEHRVVVPLEQAEGSFLELGLELGARSTVSRRVIGAVGGGRIAEAVRANLADAGANTFLDATGDDDASLHELFSDADLVTVALDAPDLALLYRCNAIALETRTPWLMAFADGPELVVGPLYRPLETGCFNDFDTQEEAGRTHRMDHLFYKAALARDGVTARPLPRLLAEHAAALLALAALQALTGAPSFLEGAVVRVDVDRLEVVRETVLRLPRCPACVGGRPDYRHPFL